MELQAGQHLLMDAKAGTKERQKTIVVKELIKMYGVKPDSKAAKLIEDTVTGKGGFLSRVDAESKNQIQDIIMELNRNPQIKKSGGSAIRFSRVASNQVFQEMNKALNDSEVMKIKRKLPPEMKGMIDRGMTVDEVIKETGKLVKEQMDKAAGIMAVLDAGGPVDEKLEKKIKNKKKDILNRTKALEEAVEKRKESEKAVNELEKSGGGGGGGTTKQ